MVSKRRNDERDYRRRGPSREPKYRILIVCEGAVTEREYFRAFRNEARNPRVHVELPDEPGVPLTVVRAAVRRKEETTQRAKKEGDDNLRFDSVWAVFDVDDHPHLREARELAERSGVELAVSNPCFELWALLHIEDQRAHIARHAVAHRLRGHFPEYEKHLPYNRLSAGYAEAVRRAMDLAKEAAQHGDGNRNPTTGVYRVTELIQKR